MKYGVNDTTDIARIVHETIREYQRINGEVVTCPWDELGHDMRDSTIMGVESALRGETPEGNHEQWMRVRHDQGWIYGPLKDYAKKTHPCLVPYDKLPAEQQVKDMLVIAITKALEPLL